jgi:hypothetical protein
MAREQDPREQKLDSLRTRIQQSTGTPDPTLYHQLGDVYSDLGDASRALEAYGQAIDGFLASARVQVAMAICTKVVRRYTKVTRTHFTAACISLYLGRVPDALRSLDDYVKAALASDSTGIAIPRLRSMATLMVDANMRQELANRLARLGDDEAERVRDGNPPAAATLLSTQKRGEMLLQLARSGPDEMWSAWLPT